MAKFYFFDTGVTHTLAGTKSVDRNSDLYGRSFEQFIAMELRAFLSYNRIKEQMTYWRMTHGDEVDFLIGEQIAIEVKTTSRVTDSHLKGLRRLQEEGVFKKYILVSHDLVETQKDQVLTLPWQSFLKRLWVGEFCNLQKN